MVNIMTGCLCITIIVITQGLIVSSFRVPDYNKEKDNYYWYKIAIDDLKKTVDAQRRSTMGRAKNIILFIGDGMGAPTVTAARILEGQMTGLKGEEHRLSFDNFPNTGLMVTYAVNTQTTDSAAAATAIVSGVKTNSGVVGLNAKTAKSNCTSSKGNEVDSILRWFLDAGKSAGVVTTTTVTHATPSSTYAHSANRDWEVDTFMPQDAKDDGCIDIATQLIKDNPDINVVLGGGMNHFKPLGFKHPYPDPRPIFANKIKGRQDMKDLTKEWQDTKSSQNLSHAFVSNRDELQALDPQQIDYLFGLFAEFHMAYEIDRNITLEPSLAEMTEKAIRVLQNNEKGYFLLVEGGRIDHGHHENKPSKALHDTIAFNEAVKKALELTEEYDTQILVTADHSHMMGIAGYATRGHPILVVMGIAGYATRGHPILVVMGIAGYATRGHPILEKSDYTKHVMDDLPYTTLLYGNGPGFTSPRQNITDIDTTDKEYQSQTAVPMRLETHGGEDVAMYAQGPQSFLYSGVHENNYIPFLMAYAACVGPHSEQIGCAPQMELNASPVLQIPHLGLIGFGFLVIQISRHSQ